MTATRSRPIRRLIAAALAFTLAVGPVVPTASAGLAALADAPIAAKVAAKPNIMFTVDDSYSMTLDYVPDWVTGSFCRKSSGSMSGTETCGSNYQWGRDVPMFAAEFNRLYYNPDVAYTAPIKADGTSYPDQDSTKTINWTKVQSDPFLSPATTTNITSNVSVPIWCNSDWPLDTTIGINGEYQAGKGADCRINGTAYDSAISGAPAVTADYNYPWKKGSGSNNAQYYWVSGGQKVLYCNTAAAGFPSQTNCTTSGQTCAGVIVTPPSVPQTCFAAGNQTSCVPDGTYTYSPPGCILGTSTYSPAGCDALPLTSVLPPRGTCSGVECVSCTATACKATANCTTQITGQKGRCHTTGPAPGTGGSNAQCNCNGVGCALPTCANYQPPQTCSTGWTTGTTTCTTTVDNSPTCDEYLNGSITTTLQNDADLVNGGTGTVCRHNNVAYATAPAVAAGLFNYPAGVFTTKVTDQCPNIPSSVNIPRHYYRIPTGATYCTGTISTPANAQWTGFGSGTCQTKNDFATYKNVKYGQFTRVDLIASQAPFAYTDPINGASTRTYAQEMTNYANWYAYYRTRILAAKTVSSIAFSYLDKTYRVGFHTFNTPATAFLNVKDFDLTQKTPWYANLFAVNPPAGAQTPTLDSLIRVGTYFDTPAASVLPSVVDPITLSCQPNYHVLITDGFTNQASLPTVAGNMDAALPALPVDSGSDHVLSTLRTPKPTWINAGPTPLWTGNWPRPLLESGALANTLADVAMYYWARDLRPGMTNNVPAVSVKKPSDPAVPDPAESDPTKDIAWWQHLSFSAISFGSDGVLDASNTDATVAAIKAGTQTWPQPLATPNMPNTPTANPGATGVDDLWHATANARGSFVFAKSPMEVSYGLSSILVGMGNNRKARVGASFAGQVLDSTNNVIYEATVESGYSGNLTKVQIDPTTAAEVATIWQARDTLAAQVMPAFDGDEPWNTKRRIVTVNPATGLAIPFRYASLTAAQLATLNANPTIQQKMVAYLRGGSTFGTAPTTLIEGTKPGQFRKRTGILGDITDSQPVIVGAPAQPYNDVNDPGYTAYKAAQAGRATRVFVGAQDGMLHSFDAADGSEVFAYIPSVLMRSTVDAAGQPIGLQALTFQDGGVPIFHHHFYVNATARAADVDFTNGGGDWHTILVGGLGKGGGVYYGIDVTNPAAADEAAAGAKVLWEFKDADLAYSFTRPMIAKTRAFGWTVVVTAGYNNPSGIGRVYFLNPKTGALLKTMTTSAGNPATPAGLAQINGFTKDFHNQTVEQIYGGDLLGNVWRFDVSDPNPNAWTTTAFATLTAPDGTMQPVTTAPRIEIDFANGVDRWVFFGTGRLLDPTDFDNPTPQQGQTLYAFKDGTLTLPKSTGLPINARSTLTKLATGAIAGITGGTANGWYEDLPVGQRIVTDLQAEINIVLYAGTQLQPDPCLTSLPANIYAREYASGSSQITDSGGTPMASFYTAEGAVGLQLAGMSNPGAVAGSLPSPSAIYTQETDASIRRVTITPPGLAGGVRFSWRLLGD